MYGLDEPKPRSCKRSLSGISIPSSPEGVGGNAKRAGHEAEATHAPEKDVVQEQWDDPSQPTVVRVYKRMGRVHAKMRKSTSGFLVAKFFDDEFETEMPNLLLDKAEGLLKRPAAAAAKKKLIQMKKLMVLLKVKCL